MFDPAITMKERLASFFMGRGYPLLVCLLVALGFILGTEVYFIPVIVLLACLSFWVCNSIRPLAVPLCTFIYSLSNGNSLFGKESTDFYISGWRLVAMIILGVIVIVSLGAFMVRNGFFSKLRRMRMPLLAPLLILSLAFLLNGAGSETWVPTDLLYGFFQVISFLIVFVLFYHGFSDDETPEELGKYFAYMSMLMSLVLIAELVFVYTTTPGIIVKGVIDRTLIIFGWGVCNNAGVYLAMLIPMNFYGAYTSRCPAWYFTVATATYVAAVFTLSRNALLVGTLIYVLSLVTLCVFGKRKNFFRTCAGILILSVLVVVAVYYDVLSTALKDYYDRGFGDEARLDIWDDGLKNFLTAPLFGKGFHGFPKFGTVNAEFIPQMAHNTVVQLLSGMGIAGLLAYGYYRIKTVVLFVKRPSIMKTMLAYGALVLLLESLLDNFLFHIHPVFHYSIALAIAARASDSERLWRQRSLKIGNPAHKRIKKGQN